MHGLSTSPLHDETAFPEDVSEAADALPAIEHPLPLDLAGHTSLRRIALRPLAERGPDFDAEFDDSTLFFDTFWAADGKRIVLIGPSLLNLRSLVEDARVTALPSGRACTCRIHTLDRQDRITLAAPAGTTHLRFESGAATLTVPVGDNRSALFAGRRVLLTKSKDNSLDWILDWVRFHRDRHGADAVLLYDNGSTRYRPEALQAALAALDGIAVARVVAWPFKFGPQGGFSGGWDSDYCELGALEHARWRYLAGARSVLSGDVDELVIARDGESVFAAAEASLAGVLRYDGIWVMGIEGREPKAGPEVRHRDYGTRLRPMPKRRLLGTVDALACFVKWTVVPSRCPERAQWCTHRITRWPAALPKTGRFTFRHFRQINTQWKYDRTALETFDDARHMHDAPLAEAVAHVRWEA